MFDGALLDLDLNNIDPFAKFAGFFDWIYRPENWADGCVFWNGEISVLTEALMTEWVIIQLNCGKGSLSGTGTGFGS